MRVKEASGITPLLLVRGGTLVNVGGQFEPFNIRRFLVLKAYASDRFESQHSVGVESSVSTL